MKAAVLAPYWDKFSKSSKLLEIVESASGVGSFVSKLVPPNELSKYRYMEYYDQVNPVVIIYPSWFSPSEVESISSYKMAPKSNDVKSLRNISHIASDKDEVMLITPDKVMHTTELR